jgi:hypothetical protein
VKERLGRQHDPIEDRSAVSVKIRIAGCSSVEIERIGADDRVAGCSVDGR